MIGSIYAATPVTGLRASYFGDSGGATSRYYWVQAVYPGGRAKLSSYVLVTTPAALSNKNVVLLIWNPMPGAISYNVYMTTTTTAPTVGSIAVALGVDTNSFTDIGQSDSLTTAAVIVDSVRGFGTAWARYSFAVDGGAISTITPDTTKYNTLIPQGAIIMSGMIFVKAAVTATGAATVAIGTSAGSSSTAIKGATGKASYTLNALLDVVPVNTAATAVRMSADGYITFTIAGDALLTGILDVNLTYLLPPE